MNHAELAALGREYLLAGHLIDRAGMPQVVGEFGLDVMREVAVDEWMGASPIYTRRMQRALGFGGDDVATIFKGMQFDIGAPHEFMDFRYRVDDEHHGEFWLASCGALMDVEPMGEDFVVAMCHHIEDPTFDATAAATNPRARMRPLHRPPRHPVDRHPHCHWVVEIDPSAEALPEPEPAQRLALSKAAAVVLDDGGEAVDEYAGSFVPGLQLEDLSERALRVVLQEVCLQGHLLARSFMVAVSARAGTEAAVRIGAKQLTGIAGLTAKRLARHLGTDDIARVLALHPALQPRPYAVFEVSAAGPDEVVLVLGGCAGLEEGDGLTWPALLAAGHDRAVAAMAQAVDPRARVRRVADADRGVAAWSIRVDPDAEPSAEMDEVLITSFSTGADFRFH